VCSLQKTPGGLKSNHTFAVCGKTFRVEPQAGDADSDPNYFDEWIPADQWKQRGFTHSLRLDGIGARFVAIHKNRQLTPLELHQPNVSPQQHRLYLMQPYSPDRIPVIMVHGLKSTPLTWHEMTNEIMDDSVLGRRYQLWHYLYPTGLPFLASAAEFRDEIGAV